MYKFVLCYNFYLFPTIIRKKLTLPHFKIFSMNKHKLDELIMNIFPVVVLREIHFKIFSSIIK